MRVISDQYDKKHGEYVGMHGLAFGLDRTDRIWSMTDGMKQA